MIDPIDSELAISTRYRDRYRTEHRWPVLRRAAWRSGSTPLRPPIEP
jgi:hypothetical protein